MKQSLKKMVAVVGIGLTALACQPVLADGGWGHHRGGYGYGRGGGWVPFALGAVVGGVAVGAMMQPQPVYAQPVYVQPPPRVYMPRPYYAPPVYVMPAPLPGYYYDRD